MAYSPADEPMIRAAVAKQFHGEPLNGDESRAMVRFERWQTEQNQLAAYEAVPKKHYRSMSGRQDKILNEQAERYGLSALRGPTVHLPTLLRQFHDFLAKNWLRFEKEIEDDAIIGAGTGNNSPAAERYRGFKADHAGIDLEARKGELLPRSDCRVGMLAIASRVRGATEQLERRFGAEAREIMERAIDDAEQDIQRLFPGTEQLNETQQETTK